MKTNTLAEKLRTRQKRKNLSPAWVLDSLDPEDLIWSYMTCAECGKKYVDNFIPYVTAIEDGEEFKSLCDLLVAIHQMEHHGASHVFWGHPDEGGVKQTLDDLEKRLEDLLLEPNIQIQERKDSDTLTQVYEIARDVGVMEAWLYAPDSANPLCRIDGNVAMEFFGIAKMSRPDWLLSIFRDDGSASIFRSVDSVITEHGTDQLNRLLKKWPSEKGHPFESVPFWKRLTNSLR